MNVHEKSERFKVKTQSHVVRWEYESHEHDATCAIDGAVCYVRVVVRHNGKAFPDVNEIEDWLIQKCKEPLTAESLLEEFAGYWNVSAVMVRCSSESHGTIEVANAMFD